MTNGYVGKSLKFLYNFYIGNFPTRNLSQKRDHGNVCNDLIPEILMTAEHLKL